MIKNICEYLCDYVGGHIYALGCCTLYFFTVADMSYLTNMNTFEQFLFSEKFMKTTEYGTIKERCYSSLKSDSIRQQLLCALSGKQFDLVELSDLGYIKENGEDIISPFLERIVVDVVSPGKLTETHQYTLQESMSAKEKLEMLLLLG